MTHKHQNQNSKLLMHSLNKRDEENKEMIIKELAEVVEFLGLVVVGVDIRNESGIYVWLLQNEHGEKLTGQISVGDLSHELAQRKIRNSLVVGIAMALHPKFEQLKKVMYG